MEIVKRIGQYKKEHNMTIFQLNRWQNVVEDRIEKGADLGLQEKFVKDLYERIHNYAIKIQSKIVNQ